MKIKILKDKTPEGIAEQIESFCRQNKVFASPIVYAKSQFVSFAYYEESKYLNNEKKPFQKKPFTGKINNPNSLATDNQINKLKTLGYKDDVSKLTKGKASEIINIMIKEGVKYDN